MQRLHAAIVAEGRDAWVDWEGIPLSADWWAEIQEGIEAANTFVFVISPDSAASGVCSQEVAHANQHNKRIVPIVYRDVSPKELPAVLGKLNWVFFRESDDFDRAFKALMASMDTDYEWVKAHTRLVRRAVEWDKHGGDASYLLRGTDLEDAEQRLAQPDKEPALAKLQIEYILSSRQYEEAERQKEIEAQEQSRKARRRIVLMGMSLILTILIVFINYGSTRSAAEHINQLEEIRLPGVLAVFQAEKHLLLMLNDIGGYLVVGTEQYWESYNQNQQLFEADLAQLEALSASFNPDDQRRIGELSVTFQDWTAGAAQLFELPLDQMEQELAFDLSQSEPRVAKMRQLLAEIADEQQRLLDNDRNSGRTRLLHTANNQSLAIGLLISVVGLSIIWVEIRGLPPKDRWKNLFGLRKRVRREIGDQS